jgi:bifunctional non-homologous end joining protein LigD
LALLCDKPPSGPQWIHEIKYDGYRIQARLDGGRVRLLTRKRLDWTRRFPTIATTLAGLSVSSALIDGEISSKTKAQLRLLRRLRITANHCSESNRIGC